jgi:putative nucleotidyltransferase with HDIG domain
MRTTPRRRTPGGVASTGHEPLHRRGAEPRWENRPVLATTLRVAVVAAPFAASVAVAIGVARLLGTPVDTPERVLWWLGVLAASLGSLVVFDRAARRLLPLAALLELSLIFPDRAPSRLGVALRSGSTGKLRAREVEALRRGDLEPAEAAHTILALAASLNVHDRDTRGHSERVRAYADLIGSELGLDPADRDRLRWAALLHDLGKLTVPAHTLHAGDLSHDDWETLRRHPIEGARLAEPLSAWLGPWGLAIEQHHERYDGTGYPFGLAGDDLSLGARIVAVADSYDAMTSARSYNVPRSAAAARQELADQAGTHFDPAVVRAFLSISLGRLRWVMGPLAFLAAVPFALPIAGVRRGLESAGRTAALGTVTLVATVAVVQPPDLGPKLAPAEAPLVRSPQAVVRTPPSSVAAPVETTTTTAPPVVITAAPAPPPAPSPAPTTTRRSPAPPTTVAPPVVPVTTAPAPAPPPAPAAPVPTSAGEAVCREEVAEQSARPCQPPRWGHTDAGNPAPHAS